MQIEIDQSGKIENTNKPTVIALAGKTYKRTIVISAREKRKLQKLFREAGKPKLFVYRTFAVVIVELLANAPKVSRVIIDLEYPGQNDRLREMIKETAVATGVKFSNSVINFGQVGKHSPAHLAAYSVYKGRAHANKILTAVDIMKIALK